MSVGSVGGGSSGALGGGQVSAYNLPEGVAFVVPHNPDLSGSFSGLDSSGSLDPSGFVRPLEGRKIKKIIHNVRTRPEVERRPGGESSFTTTQVARSLFDPEDDPLSMSAGFEVAGGDIVLNIIPTFPENGNASDGDISDNDDDLSDSDTSDEDEPAPVDPRQINWQAMLAKPPAVLPEGGAKSKTEMSQPEFDKSLASYNRAIRIAKDFKKWGRVLSVVGAIAAALLLGAPWILVGLGAALNAGTLAVSWIKGSTVLSPITEGSLGRAVNWVATSPLIKTLTLVSALVGALGVCLWSVSALVESSYHDKINNLKQQNPKWCHPNFS